MQPGEQLPKVFAVINASGAGVTGLVTGDFTVQAQHTPYGGATATWTHGLVVSELGSGWYRALFTLPPTGGTWLFQLAHATHQVVPWAWEDELEYHDRDAISGLVSAPTVTISSINGTIGSRVDLPPIICKRRAVIAIAVRNANGDPAPINVGYTTWKVGFRSQTDQTATPPKLDAIHGTPTDFGLVITPGLITITIPDDCTIFNVLAEGANPTESATIDMEVTAENPAGQTVSIVAPSPLTIRKRAEGA